jgi:hypothetical protein
MIALPALTGLTAADAEWFDQVASAKRALAVGTAPAFRAQHEAEAVGVEALAAALRDPVARGMPVLRRGRGGEATPPDACAMPGRQRELAQAVTATPGTLEADASLARLALARDGNVLTLAVATAQDAGAATSTEKCLAHQFAAAHRLAMELLALASDEAHKHRKAPHLNTGALAEAARTATAAARLMDACTRSALGQDRLRNGGRQVVTVQHVTVQDGGQAVVAGRVAPGDGIAAPPLPARGGEAK